MSDLDKFNYECEDQIDIFDLIRKPISIAKPIRLIELFAGYGSQAMALRDYVLFGTTVGGDKNQANCRTN